MTPNADRAAVAREVLTDMADWFRDEEKDETAARVVESYRDVVLPAPPAPETVTVGAVNTLRTGTANTLAVTVGDRAWTLEVDGRWRWGSLVVERSNWAHDMLDRIASDARVLAEREARIAELEKQLHEQHSTLYDSMWQAIDRMGDAVGAFTGPGSNCHVTAQRVCDAIEALKSERDAALRALEEAKLSAVRVARGCRDYGGGYRSHDTLLNAFHHGIDTVGNAIEAWAGNANNTQVRALEEATVTYGVVTETEPERGARGPLSGSDKPAGSSAALGGGGIAVNSQGGEATPSPDFHAAGQSCLRSPSPAPIPLGATVEVGDTKWTRVERGWDDGVAWYSESCNVGQLVTAHYRATHPVATRETVERVAELVTGGFVAQVPLNAARKIVSFLGFTLETGDGAR